MATEYLIKSGNRKIATITGPDLDRIVDSKERLKGFKECLIDNHLELKPEYIQNGNFSYESGYLATKKLLALDNPPEAIFIAEDQMALGAISAATELEKNIPNDLAIIGFDNIIQAKYSNPKLSTVSQPKTEMGKKAAEILINLIEGNAINERQVIFKPKLIIRETC